MQRSKYNSTHHQKSKEIKQQRNNRRKHDTNTPLKLRTCLVKLVEIQSQANIIGHPFVLDPMPLETSCKADDNKHPLTDS